MEISKSKITQWRQFSKIVENHISDYVVSQYGDFPDKNLEQSNEVKIQAKLEAYVNRIGRSARGKDDALRDALKIAHSAAYLFATIAQQNAQADLRYISGPVDADIKEAIKVISEEINRIKKII